VTHQYPPHLAFALPNSEETSIKAESESGNLVAEFMILAGRIAASHLSSHNVPALYRAQDAPGANSPEALQEFLSSRNMENGLTTFENQLEKGIIFLPAYFSSTPSNHWTMGIKASSGGYVQATSPLRRYNDMMIHWQLKSTLKEGKPAFSYMDIEQHIKQYTPFDKLLKNLDKRSRNFWKLYVLHQKMQEIRKDPSFDPKASDLLLNGLTGKVIAHKLDYASLKIVARLLIPELGGMIATLVLEPKEYGDIKVGRKFNVEIADIILIDYSKMFVRLRN
jgi:exoribonuclease II